MNALRQLRQHFAPLADIIFSQRAIRILARPHDDVHAAAQSGLAFRSDATNQFMVAVSAPVRDAEGKVIGVLARTTHLGHLLDDYAVGIRGGKGDEVDRVVALYETREGRLLDHPWMTEQIMKSLPDATFDKLHLQPEIVGEGRNYLVENASVTMTFVDDKPVQVELPPSVVLTVTDAPSGGARFCVTLPKT